MSKRDNAWQRPANNNHILGCEAAVDDVSERPYDGNEINNQPGTV